jgi:hypothetical protein
MPQLNGVRFIEETKNCQFCGHSLNVTESKLVILWVKLKLLNITNIINLVLIGSTLFSFYTEFFRNQRFLNQFSGLVVFWGEFSSF